VVVPPIEPVNAGTRPVKPVSEKVMVSVPAPEEVIFSDERSSMGSFADPMAGLVAPAVMLMPKFPSEP
jgi:hypothetical protein